MGQSWRNRDDGVPAQLTFDGQHPVGRHDDDYALSDEQKAAVAELSRSNVYAKQSKWKTLHELPMTAFFALPKNAFAEILLLNVS